MLSSGQLCMHHAHRVWKLAVGEEFVSSHICLGGGVGRDHQQDGSAENSEEGCDAMVVWSACEAHLCQSQGP